MFPNLIIFILYLISDLMFVNIPYNRFYNEQRVCLSTGLILKQQVIHCHISNVGSPIVPY